ncbi:hypothetical protein JOD64_000694 [Micromonospora luteifusca]|uniref:Helix-turn-helix domain-containing protein n=1 Tax=Micromonospora luteifusca TaxID=709860 RepID=A0ABS2LNC2_9ACTN|nr:hypothetical protein [Micromonospora luteifusca]MBM7489472.1 hypothetical protein [Micromonospora luteifusca]
MNGEQNRANLFKIGKACSSMGRITDGASAMTLRSQDGEAQRRLAASLTQLFHESRVRSVSTLASSINRGRGTVDRVLKGGQVPEVQLLEEIVRGLGGGDDEVKRFLGLRLAIFSADVESPISSSSDRMEGSPQSLTVRYFDTTQAFYSALTSHLELAKNEICVTYIRELPPTRYANEAARKYFAELLKWAELGDRRVLRVIGVPTQDGAPKIPFVRWLKDHYAETAEILAYEAKIIPWSVDADNINMALIDGRTTFITFSGMSTQDSGNKRPERRKCRISSPVAEVFRPTLEPWQAH